MKYMKVLSRGGGTVGSGSSGSKEYDDLHTFLYYDDRIVTIGDIELPLCGLVASVMINFVKIYPTLNAIIKIDNTGNIPGMHFGNYMPIEYLNMGSGDLNSILVLINGISIPKYILSDLLTGSGVFPETEKIYIFDLLGEETGNLGEILKTSPTITREEFFDLLK